MADNDVCATSASGRKKRSSCIKDMLLLSTAITQQVPSSSSSSSEADSSLHCNKSKHSNKRKRKRNNNYNKYCPSASSTTTIEIETATMGTSTTTARTTTVKDIPHTDTVKRLFNGLIVAISTLESSEESTKLSTTNRLVDHDDNNNNNIKNNNNNNNNNNITYQNYKSLQQTLRHHGATISPQVHKRVHYLLCTRSAMTHATQRVRQAHKRNVDIVDVAWVKECIDTGKIVEVEKYLCNDEVGCWIAEKEKEKKKQVMKRSSKRNVFDIDEKYDNVDEGGGWSTPIQLECCCVCHENGDDDCPWCIDCNLTLARKQKKTTND
jgi:hypothetical protein